MSLFLSATNFDDYSEGQRGRRVGGETIQAKTHTRHMCTFILGNKILKKIYFPVLLYHWDTIIVLIDILK